MVDRDELLRRGHVTERTRRDLQRLRRREAGDRFWRSIALVGSVGWPIVLLAAGGAFLGRSLDDRFETGVRFTLMLVALGAAIGSAIAFRTLRGNGP